MHSFTYVRGFPCKGFFTRLRVLTRHLRILFLSYSPVFLCIFHMRGSVRIRWRPEMRRHPEMRRRPDMTESPSTGLGGQSSVLCHDGLPLYREILCPHNTVIQSSCLSIHIFQQYLPICMSFALITQSVLHQITWGEAHWDRDCTLVQSLGRT